MGHMEDILDDGGTVLQTAAAGIVKVTGIDGILSGIGTGHRSLFQKIRQVMHGIQGSAPVFPDDLDRSFPHLFTQGIVPRDLQESLGQAIGIGYHAAGAHLA